MSEPGTYSLAEGVATFTLNRPERLNALTPSLFARWHEAIDLALADKARALVITGAGRAFSAGADLDGGDREDDRLGADLGSMIDRHYNPLIRRLAGLDIPIVTAVNGPAVGAGMGLALAGDIVVAARSAYFLLAFANIGLVPDAGTTWLVTRAVGRARTLELALLGDRIGVERALEMGLITRVTNDDSVLEEAQQIAGTLARGAGRAIGLIRKQVAFALDHDFEAVLDRERDNQRIAGFTADFAEAVAAFGEKRAPMFRGE